MLFSKYEKRVQQNAVLDCIIDTVNVNCTKEDDKMNGLDWLLTRIADGDNDAFEKLYLKTRRGVYAFLYTYYRNHHDTEDAMQSVYLRIKQKIYLYTTGGNARSWMLEIAKNFALNDIKRRSYTELTDDESSFNSHAKNQSSELIITDLMERYLTDEERKILVLHVIWGYKHREIAELLGLPTGTVRSKYKRAVDKLKEAGK